jgi:hypothetical protein
MVCPPAALVNLGGEVKLIYRWKDYKIFSICKLQNDCNNTCTFINIKSFEEIIFEQQLIAVDFDPQKMQTLKFFNNVVFCGIRITFV